MSLIPGEKKHTSCKYFFDEYEIVIEEEGESTGTKRSEQDRVQDYEVTIVYNAQCDSF